MNLQILMAAILALSLGACSFRKPSAQTPEEKAAAEVLQTIEQQKFNGQLSDENVRVQFLESPFQGGYELVVTWPKDVPAMKLSLNDGHYTIISNSNTFKSAVLHSSKHSIHLVALNSIGGEISAHSVSATAPKDMILNKEIYLSENTNIEVNRLYINKPAFIQTNGKNLSIEANKLYVDAEVTKDNSPMDLRSAHIITIVPGSVATSLEQLKGSSIDIKARKAYGQLRIGMIGINGKDGANGANAVATSSLDGAPGRAGDVRQAVDSCLKPNGLPCGNSVKLFCITPPSNGADGKKGHTGLPGENGWNGGNSGMLAVVVEDASEFRLEVALRRGLPGKGGTGGLGSAGGRGGQPGENPHGKCGAAQAGAPGPQGDPGATGADGALGLIHQPITNLTNALIYEIR